MATGDLYGHNSLSCESSQLSKNILMDASFLKCWCISESLKVFVKVNIPQAHSLDVPENQQHAYLMSVPGDSDADARESAIKKGSVEPHTKMLASRWPLATRNLSVKVIRLIIC